MGKNEWISVEDKLPEFPFDGCNSRVVICCEKDGYVSPMYYKRVAVRGKSITRWRYIWNRIYDRGAITHWMPLPEPPEVK